MMGVINQNQYLADLDTIGGQEHKDAVNQYYQDIFVRLPENTQRAYKSDIKDYQRFCNLNKLTSFSPDESVTEKTVKHYMLHLCSSDSISHATVIRRKSAISKFLGMAKLPNPIKNGEYINALVKRELSAQKKYSRGDQATPLTIDLLEQINACFESSNLLDARDLAIINVMYDALLRSDEACKVRVGDINRRDFTLYVPATKSDQTGKGSFRYISKTSIQLVDKYLALANLNVTENMNYKQLSREYLFRGLSPKKSSVLEANISYPTIYRVFQRLSRLANLNMHLSSHSPRVGAAVTMAENGVSDLEIQRAGGWKTTAMVAQYTEQARVSSGGMAQTSKKYNR
jgi:site-specific recombinase XerD